MPNTSKTIFGKIMSLEELLNIFNNKDYKEDLKLIAFNSYIKRKST